MDDFENVFNEKRWSERRAYDHKIKVIDRDEQNIKDKITALRTDGIVLLNHDEVKDVHARHEIDLYKVFAAKCKRWGRPYVKCVQAGDSRIVVSVSGIGQARGLVASLLMTAEEIKPDTKTVKRKWTGYKEQVVDEPDPIANTGMQYSDAPVRSWVTARTVTVLFQGVEGYRVFVDWREFCTTNKTQRLYLGL